MPAFKVNSELQARRSTRGSRNLAADKGAAISPLRSLPTDTTKKPAAIRPNSRANKSRLTIEQPFSSNDDADDSSSQPHDSRSQSVDEPESRSSSPPALQQAPARARRSNAPSKSRSASPAHSDTQITKPKRGRAASTRAPKAPAPRKLAVAKSRKVAPTAAATRPRRGARGPTELSTIQESATKTPLPGSFPSAVLPVAQTPSATRITERAHTPASHTSAIKRKFESPPNQSVDPKHGDNSILSQSVKRARHFNHTPTSKPHNYAPEIVEQQSSTATPSHVQSAGTPTVHSAQSNNTVVRHESSYINDESTFTPDDQSTPVAHHGLFAFARNMFTRATPTAKTTRNASGQATTVASGNTSTTPVATRQLPSQNFTAPPMTHTTVAEDFGFPKMTPRPFPLIHGRPQMPLSARKPAREKELFEISYVEDGEEDDDNESIHEEDVVTLTPAQLRESKKNMKAALGHLGKYNEAMERINPGRKLDLDQPHIRNTNARVVEKKVIAPTSGPSMPKIFINALVIPASVSGDRMILTDPKLIELVRAAAIWATSDPENHLPNPGQMTEFLDRFGKSPGMDDLITNNPTTSDNPINSDNAITSSQEAISGDHLDTNELNHPPQSVVVHPPYSDDDLMMSGGISGQEVSAEDEDSEVEEQAGSSPFVPNPTSSPAHSSQVTPIAPTTTPRGGGFFSGVKNLIASPMKLLGFTPATTDITAGIDFSPSKLRDPKSPTPYHKAAQRKHKASVLKAQKKQDVLEQDNADGDIHGAERRVKRVAFNTRDEVHEFQADESSTLSPNFTTGQKRPHSDRPWLDPMFGRTDDGGFGFPEEMPDFDSFDDEDESQNAGSRNDDSQIDESQTIDSQIVGSSTPPAKSTKATDGYTGTLFRQPSIIQANIDRGLSPISGVPNGSTAQHMAWHLANLERIKATSSTTSPVSASTPLDANPLPTSVAGNLFGSVNSTTSTTGDRSGASNSTTVTPGKLFSATDFMASTSGKLSGTSNSTTPYDPTTDTESVTYSFPDDLDDDSTILDGSTENGSPAQTLQSENDGRNGPLQASNEDSVVAGSSSTKSVQNVSSVLQDKQWEQSPPPKPRPTNATLPAPYNKYVPEKPSLLKFCKNMSPLHPDHVMNQNAGADENAAFDAADNAPSPPLPNPSEGDSDLSMHDYSHSFQHYERLAAAQATPQPSVQDSPRGSVQGTSRDNSPDSPRNTSSSDFERDSDEEYLISQMSSEAIAAADAIFDADLPNFLIALDAEFA